MAKKFVALFLLAAFGLFNVSCVSTVVKSAPEIDRTNAKARIVSVVKTDGSILKFPKNEPGRILLSSDSVVGRTDQLREFAEDDIKRIYRDEKGNILEIETNDGQVFKILSSKKSEDGTLLCAAYGPVTIPFSEIQQVWIRKVDSRRMILNGVKLVAGVAVIAGLSYLTMWALLKDEESCPFVYSWNGEEYVLDAEPYGAAISEGLKRTDWVELSALRESAGEYRALLANELDETQYTDELKLVAVDHAPGVTVAPDLAGGFHTFSAPLPPASAVDQTGRDVLTFVAKNDEAFWLSDLAGRDPDGDGEFRDELVFEFPKPAGAKRAKLLANVWTTSWGSRAPGMFLEHYGTSLSEKYAEVDGRGPMYTRLVNWMLTEELATLKVWVETPAGWKARSMIMGGAPVITKDKAYVLDVADIPGETLRVKLRPPVNFWMVNSLAADYGEESAVHVTELAAVKAVDHTGRDVRAELASTDRSYLVSPNRGERTELVFAAPPLKEGLARTVFVKASGYYKVHVDATGEPRLDLAERILTEPGFAARYSFREYLKWEAGVRAEMAGTKR